MRGKNNSKVSANYELPTFVNCELSDEERAMLADAETDSTALWAWVEELLADHYRLSLTYQDEGDVYAVTLTGKENQSVNAGLALTARAGTISRALFVLSYKHTEKLHEDWRKNAKQKARGGIG